MALIYKIVTTQAWAAAVETGRFDGAAIDLTDGFIHFSTREQVKETAAKHFAGQDGLLLVGVASQDLGDALVYEASRGGAAISPSLRPPADRARKIRPASAVAPGRRA